MASNFVGDGSYDLLSSLISFHTELVVEKEPKDVLEASEADEEKEVADEGEAVALPNPWISFVILRAFKRASLRICPPPSKLSIWSDFFCMLTPQLNLS
ncbi:hypothetical protein ACFXTH_012733 [Malus domestica]